MESTLWWKSDASLPGPGIQPVFLEFPPATPELASRLPSSQCYTISPSVVRPASRGSVMLASSDPTVAPIIDVNFLACDADMRAMLSAVELCRDIGNSSAFGEFRKQEVMPGPLTRSEMISFARNAVSTYFHPTSTCRMGPGNDCVVDHTLRVHGLESLRIADASIMPGVTSGNTNAPSVMIGEKLVDLLRSGA